MWGAAATALMVAAFIALIGSEVVRSVVHRHRERVYGIGATQDIAMWGILITFASILPSLNCIVL